MGNSKCSLTDLAWARGRPGTGWNCKELPSCIVFGVSCRFYCEALNAALLVGLAGERSGMLANKPGASLGLEHLGPTASAISSRNWSSWLLGRSLCLKKVAERSEIQWIRGRHWRSWSMKVDALRTMLVHWFMFKNPFCQESPCSSGDKILGWSQKNQGIHWEGLKFKERKVLWNPDL